MFATTAPTRTHRQARPARIPYDRPAAVLADLQHAREIVAAGWVQNRWTAPAAAPAPVTARVDAPADPTARACLVAAVALAARAHDPRADLAVATGPALAHVWDAVHDDARLRAGGRAAPHAVRVARMRELARWNDEPGRTRADVVAALDRAAAAVVTLTVRPARA